MQRSAAVRDAAEGRGSWGGGERTFLGRLEVLGVCGREIEARQAKSCLNGFHVAGCTSLALLMSGRSDSDPLFPPGGRNRRASCREASCGTFLESLHARGGGSPNFSLNWTKHPPVMSLSRSIAEMETTSPDPLCISISRRHCLLLNDGRCSPVEKNQDGTHAHTRIASFLFSAPSPFVLVTHSHTHTHTQDHAEGDDDPGWLKAASSCKSPRSAARGRGGRGEELECSTMQGRQAREKTGGADDALSRSGRSRSHQCVSWASPCIKATRSKRARCRP